MEIKKICVVGGGLMGRQIALCAAIHGYEATLYDLKPEVLDAVKVWHEDYMAGRLAKGRMTQEEVDAILEETSKRMTMICAAAADPKISPYCDFKKDPALYEANMEWYKTEIGKCTTRKFTTGFFYGKPDHDAQIYDSNTYVKEYTYLGYAEEVDEKLAALLDKNGMKPDFLERKYKCSICSDSCVHPDTGGHCSCRADRIKEAKAFYKDKE